MVVSPEMSTLPEIVVLPVDWSMWNTFSFNSVCTIRSAFMVVFPETSKVPLIVVSPVSSATLNCSITPSVL